MGHRSGRYINEIIEMRYLADGRLRQAPRCVAFHRDFEGSLSYFPMTNLQKTQKDKIAKKSAPIALENKTINILLLPSHHISPRVIPVTSTSLSLRSRMVMSLGNRLSVPMTLPGVTTMRDTTADVKTPTTSIGSAVSIVVVIVVEEFGEDDGDWD